MRRMKREEMEKAREHMTPAEVERMAERQKAVEAARYKPEEVLAQREAELWDEFAAIKLRVNRRIPLWDIEQRRAVVASQEASDVLDDPTADEATKAGAMRKLLYDPFKDIDEQLTPEEKEEMEEMKGARARLITLTLAPSLSVPPRPPARLRPPAAHPDRIGKAEMERLQVLLNTATGRRIEQRVDELLQTEDDVLV